MMPLSGLQVALDFEAFLHAQFPASSNGVGRDVDLFDAGVIDSVGVAETLAYIEERYDVMVPDDVLLSDEFTTIAGISRTIVALVADAAAPPTGLQQT